MQANYVTAIWDILTFALIGSQDVNVAAAPISGSTYFFHLASVHVRTDPSK